MRRPLAILLVLALLAPSVAAVPDARLAVSDVTVAPETPVVGEPVTVTATVRNSAGSPSPADVTAVRLVDGNRTLAEASNPGSLSAGDTLAVGLSHTFERAGARNLSVVAVGEDSDDERVQVRRPVTVVVEQSPPQVELSVDRTVATARTQIQAEVSNPNTEQYRNVTVRLDAPGAVVDRRVVPALAGGATATLNLSFAPPSAGNVTVAADVTYTTDTGVTDATRYAERVRVEPLRDDVGVSVSPVEQQPAQAATGGIQGLVGGGATLQQQGGGGEDEPPDAVAVDVTNFGNAPVRDAVVVPAADDRRLPRRYVGTLAPGESTTVEVALDSVRRPANVTARVDYRTGNETGRAVGAYDYRPPEGAVRLTGVSLSLDGETLTLSGNAGNVGTGEVTGVVVAVGESEHVRPAYPQRTYFVGTVGGSEFTPFELTADVDTANASMVPVEVTYRSDGVEQTVTVELPFERAAVTDDAQAAGSDLSVFIALGGGLALAVVGGAALTRRYR